MLVFVMKKMSIDEAAKMMSVTRTAATNRLCALGYTTMCSRCGGSGKYSYNQIDGDRCFGCNGKGKAISKLTATTVTEALARIAAGELDAYIAANKARNAIKSKVAAVWKTYMASPISNAYTALSMDSTVSPADCLDSPAGRAQRLQNDVMDTITHGFEKGLDPIVACQRVDSAHSMLRSLIAAWIAA